jgi:hypothetical protein
VYPFSYGRYVSIFIIKMVKSDSILFKFKFEFGLI